MTVQTILRDEREDAFRFVSRQTEQHEAALERIYAKIRLYLRGEITADQVMQAIRIGDVQVALIGRLGERTIDQHLAETQDLYLRAFNDAGRAAAAGSFFDLEFDSAASRALRYAEQNAGRFITNVTDSTITAVRNQLTRSIETGESPILAARRVRPMIGLTDGHSLAVERFYQKSLERGVKQTQAARNSNLYARRLIKYRSENIARTEMLTSANAGQFEYFQQLADAGLIDRATIVKEWVTAQDDRLCDECAPMDGLQVTTLDAQFVSDKLGHDPANLVDRKGPAEFRFYPPLHNMCRCTIIIL